MQIKSWCSKMSHWKTECGCTFDFKEHMDLHDANIIPINTWI